MLSDAVLRLAVAALPASSRERYRGEWTAEASELPGAERLGHATRILARAPQLRFAIGRPRLTRQLVGGAVVQAGERGPNPLVTALLALLAVPPVLIGACIVAAGATVRAACAAAPCVPLESAQPQDGAAFQAGQLAWTGFFLYGPAGPSVLVGLSVIAALAIYLGLPRTFVGSAPARFFVLAGLVVIAVWLLVLVFAPEIGYVTNLTE